jgi:hypothetical protein
MRIRYQNNLEDLVAFCHFCSDHSPAVRRGQVILRRTDVQSSFADQKLAAGSAAQPSPRGLLPFPPAVAEHVEREALRAEREYGFKLSAEATQRMLHQGTLDWFYRDQWVSYRVTAQGVEVLAVGLEEVGELAGRLNAEQRIGVKTKLV